MSSKKLKETTGVSAAVGHAGSAWTKRLKNEKKVPIAAVYPPKKNKSKNSKSNNLPYTHAAVLEKKSERALREAVRNLIFLNRVKYHEEQVRRELQEQKIRRVVRYLLNEANKSTPVQTTTGENNALNFLHNVKATTFDQLYAQLASESAQRDAFKQTYKEKIKLYLDALDQQHLILNPEDKVNYDRQQSGNMASQESQPPEQSTPSETPAEPEITPEEPTNLTEADMGGAPAAGATLSNLKTVSDTSHIQSQVIVAQLSKSNLHPTGVEQAKKALVKDLPQIDALYNILTFRPLQLPGTNGQAGEITSDRGAFRKMLIGSMPNSGAPGTALEKDNLDIFFSTVDDNVLTSDKKSGTAMASTQETPTQLGSQAEQPAGLEGEEEPDTGTEVPPV